MGGGGGPDPQEPPPPSGSAPEFKTMSYTVICVNYVPIGECEIQYKGILVKCISPC